MNTHKAQWVTEGDNVRISMPFSKVDKEKRIVSGFASLDNVDKQNDIVTAEASVKAFKKFRGNIREMHQPSAVGKMVSFKEDKYYDTETEKMYSGVIVSAYISKGAQDAWEKVLDGTYTGFSIGGRMNKWDDAFDDDTASQIRVIKDYDLVELSLVDNPANQFANIISVQKIDGVDVIKGDSVDTVLENVFWDKQSGLVLLSENEVEKSPTTGNDMQNIGFVEKIDNEKTEMIKFLVDSAKGINTSKINKEANPMAKTTKKVEEIVEKSTTIVENVEVAPEVTAVTETLVAEVAKADEAVVAEVTEETVAVEKADEATTAETVVEVAEVSKSDDVILDTVKEIKNDITSAFSDLVATVKSLQAEVELLKATKIDTDKVKNSFDAVAKDIAATNEKFDIFGKRVDAVEADTAFRKSGDLGEIVQEQPEMVEKSLWGGRFLKTADLFN
jgi:hypothetical protein